MIGRSLRLRIAALLLGTAFLLGNSAGFTWADDSAAAAKLPDLQKILKTSSNSTDIQAALFTLGDLYARGGAVAPDGAKAIDYFEKAAKAGNGYATVRIGELYRDGRVVPQDLAKALDSFRKTSDAGIAAGSVNLGKMLIAGQGVAADVDKGLALIQAAAGKGDQDGLQAMGDLYARGPLPLDGPKAIDYFEKSANAGNAYANVRIGELYRDGLIVPRDLAKALDSFQKASDAGVVAGSVNLGKMLIAGQGMPADVNRGTALIQSAADMGDQGAFQTLGDLYSRGPLPLDGAKALENYEKSASAGNAYAYVRIGEIYRDGRVVSQDSAKAMDAFQKASDAGVAAGAVNLGKMLIAGQGVAVDVDKGVALIQAATDKGDQGALQAMGDLYARGPLPIDGAKAIDYFEKAAKAGNAYATLRIGELYRDGLLVPQDLTRALDSFQKASDAGVAAGSVSLGKMLIAGQGVAVDVDKGVALIQAAADKGDQGAFQALGDLYSRGPLPLDGAKALENYEKSASAGNAYAYIRIGEIYRDGVLVKANPKRAIENFKLAAAKGQPSGVASLASGHVYRKFGTLSKPETGIKLLVEAQAAGNLQGMGTLANAYLYGLGVKKNVAKAVALLAAGAKGGDKGSVNQLISYYRDGRGKDIARSPRKAKAVLETYRALLQPGEARLAELLIDASTAFDTRAYARIAEELRTVPSTQRAGAINQLRSANENAYVFVVQSALAEKGLYKGKPNGQLTAPTVRAIAAFCAANGRASECRQGPMSGRTTNVLASLL